MNQDQIRADYAHAIERIENSKTYSNHAKKVLAAKAWAQASAQLETLRQGEVAQVATRRAQLDRKMFGHPGTADANTSVLRRDANDRAAKIDDPRAAASTIARAHRDGDHTLAQAVAKRACDFGWTEVIDQYASINPEFGDAAREWNSLPGTGDDLWEAKHSAHFYLPTPSGIDPGQARMLAAEDLEAA